MKLWVFRMNDTRKLINEFSLEIQIELGYELDGNSLVYTLSIIIVNQLIKGLLMYSGVRIRLEDCGLVFM